jgi:exodeoxyribonuclease VIII
MINATSSFKSGFYENIQFSEYLADPAVNNSSLKIFSQSPAKFKYWRDNDKPATGTQTEGSALHCLILQPELFEKSFGSEAAPRKGSAARTEWEEDNPHAVALTPNQWKNVHNMARSFENTPCTVAKELLTEGTPELSVWFDDPLTGLRCKIRPDWLRDDDIVIDLKSTKDGSPKGFFWEIKRWGYNHQAAFYKRGVDLAYAAAGVKREVKAFIIIAIENFPPYEVAVYIITEEIIAEAQIQINASLERYAECLKTDVWPGYPNRIMIPGDQEEAIYD